MPALFNNLSYLDRIKLTMLIMMTCGHIAWAFIPTNSFLGQALHFIARSTVILACFLVVEGFYRSKDIKGYLKRLFGFSLLAQIPYMMMMVGIWHLIYQPVDLLLGINVLFTLGLCLLSLICYKKIEVHQNTLKKSLWIIPIVILAILAHILQADWGYSAILWTLAIYKKRVLGFIIATLFLVLLSIISDNPHLDTVFSGQPMDYGIILSIPIMYWYDKNKAFSPTDYRLPRTFFYWYYVLHAVIIGLLVQFTPYATDEYGALLNDKGEPIHIILPEYYPSLNEY